MTEVDNYRACKEENELNLVARCDAPADPDAVVVKFRDSLFACFASLFPFWEMQQVVGWVREALRINDRLGEEHDQVA